MFSLFHVRNRSCRRGFKPCYNRRCVPHSKLCDGENDCGDNSDELDCKGKHMSHQPRNIIMLSVPQTLLQCIPESSGVSPFWYITLTSIYGPCFGQCCWRELLESIENWWLFFCLWFLFLSLLTSRFFFTFSVQPPYLGHFYQKV